MTADLFNRRGAVVDGLYRYSLWRLWDENVEPLVWVLLNPSSADAEKDDPTLRRCVNFTRRWQTHGGVVLVNLFALRSTDPHALRSYSDPVGPENDQTVLDACAGGRQVILAWGNGGDFRARGEYVTRSLRRAGVKPDCLGITQTGQPAHPLYLSSRLMPVPFPNFLR